MKKNVKGALKASLLNEEKSVQDRFDKAEFVMTQTETVKAQKQTEEPVSQPQEKVLRDTFTMLEKDKLLLRDLKLRCMKAGVEASKSELIRAGIQMLNDLPDSELTSMIEKLERLKVGRKSVLKGM